VKVSTEDAKKAESLVRLLLETPSGLAEVLLDYKLFSNHPYLRNRGILASSASLAAAQSGTPEFLRLQDEVYIRVCIYGNERRLTGAERQEAMELDRALIQMVQDLESQ